MLDQGPKHPEANLDTGALVASETATGMRLDQSREELREALSNAEPTAAESGLRVQGDLDALLAELDQLAGEPPGEPSHAIDRSDEVEVDWSQFDG